MGVVQIVGVVLVSGATCWVLGWCSSEASRIESERRQQKREQKGQVFRDW